MEEVEEEEQEEEEEEEQEEVGGQAQAMALERAALSRHVAEVLQRVLGTPPRDTVAAWGRAEDEDEEGGEGPLLPPPAFRDPPGGRGPLS
ncbi:hypothetical protein DUI87_33058 [Hirundo rustica rustica]|uniref:Uncharacterized protein n=1 Tax=Hirundo rustica rustica TaxID=333673 RepID=A0A3M0INI5_HIRRU|nr:hypothetical protein DUI87_33058 [Hirundo rustica rustica]